MAGTFCLVFRFLILLSLKAACRATSGWLRPLRPSIFLRSAALFICPPRAKTQTALASAGMRAVSWKPPRVWSAWHVGSGRHVWCLADTGALGWRPGPHPATLPIRLWGGDAFMRLFGIHNVTMCLDNAFYLYAFPQCPIVLMVAGFGCRAFPTPAFHRMGRARRVHPFVTRAPRRSANWPCVSLSILSPPLFTWMVADTSCPLTDNAIMFKESIVDVIFLHVVINSVLNVFPKK